VSLREAEFGYLRNMLQQHASILLDADKEYLVESRLTPLAYKEGMESAQHLLENLRRSNFGLMHRKVLDAMMNNETWFFRDFEPFEVLRRVVLPELLGSRANTRVINIWSGASSSGQEAYSIAMLLRECFGDMPGWSFRIIGTDISEAILARARTGRYSQLEVNRGLPAKYLAKYFTRDGSDWILRDEIRAMVDFRIINLHENWQNLPKFDVVFLRNVLIYFDVELRKKILSRVVQTMTPDGYFFMGAAETTHGLSSSFQRVAWEKSAYYRLIM